jgi:hypothetical protein
MEVGEGRRGGRGGGEGGGSTQERASWQRVSS